MQGIWHPQYCAGIGHQLSRHRLQILYCPKDHQYSLGEVGNLFIRTIFGVSILLTFPDFALEML